MKDEERQAEGDQASRKDNEKNQITPGFQFCCAFLD